MRDDARNLSKADIIEALEMLSSALESSETPHVLLIAGGAALVLLYDARSSTRDVDAVFSDIDLREAARQVSVSLNLPEDWLNDGAKGYLHGLAPGLVVLQTPSLVVRALAAHQLLAMKLCAWRDDIDIADARLLVSKVQGAMDEIWRQIEPCLVPGRELKARLAFEDLWESEHGVA